MIDGQHKCKSKKKKVAFYRCIVPTFRNIHPKKWNDYILFSYLESKACQLWINRWRVRNLVSTRWLTDGNLTDFANLINTTITNTLCFVLQHPSVMFSHLDKMERITFGQEVLENIIIILNIARTEKGETNIALEGTDGCHWTLIFQKKPPSLW